MTTSPRPLLLASLWGAMASLSGIGLLATSGWLITRASERPPVFALSVAIGAVQAFALGRGLARYAQRLSVHRFSLDLLARTRLDLFDQLESRVPGLRGLRSGKVLAGFMSDAEAVATGSAKTLSAAIDVGSSVLLGVLLTAVVQPPVGLLLLAGAASMLAIAFGISRTGRGAARLEADLRSELADSVMEVAYSARELAAYGREDLVQGRLDSIRARSVSAAWHRSLTSGLSAAATTVVGAGTLAAVLAAGVDAARAGRLSGVMLAVVAFTAMAVLDQCSAVPAVLADRDTAACARSRLEDLARLPVPVQEPDTDRTPAAGGPVTVGLDRAVVTVGGESILAGVSLRIPPGERVALVGPNGSGKTSVVSTLLHFLGCSSGRAVIGSVDVADMSREGIARYLSWVGDDSHLFATSLADNLRLARPSATDGQIGDALARVGLGDWLEALPEGLATRLGAGGRTVSAGERQRIGLARCVLAGTDVLLLDEPTAHVDPASAGSLLDELVGAAGERSVLLISHDPDVERHVDTVVSLARGAVVGRTAGPPIADSGPSAVAGPGRLGHCVDVHPTRGR